jgi:hypothetical protein
MSKRMVTFNGPAMTHPDIPESKVVFVRRIIERDAKGSPTRIGGEEQIRVGAKVDLDDLYHISGSDIYLESGQATLDSVAALAKPVEHDDEEAPVKAGPTPVGVPKDLPKK